MMCTQRLRDTQTSGGAAPGTSFRFRRTLALLGLVLALAGPPHQAARADDEARPRIKTSLPSDADATTPRAVSLEDLFALPYPADAKPWSPQGPSQTRRYEAKVGDGLHEGAILSVTGLLQSVSRQRDGDYQIQILATGDTPTRCLIAESPNDEDDDDIADPRVVGMAKSVNARLIDLAFRGARPKPGAAVKLDPPVAVRIVGQLYLNDRGFTGATAQDGIRARGKFGCQSPTLWELHPIVTLTLSDQR